MKETSKLESKRRKLGYYDKYFVGNGLEIGGGTDPLVSDKATITQHTLPNGSSYILPFKDAQFDFVYASHVLEHFREPAIVLREWLRVVKHGGFVFFAVPDFILYEKGVFPSQFNAAHKSFFAVEYLQELLSERFSGCRVELLYLEDQDYDYNKPLELDQTRGGASAQIECCIKKC